MWSKRGVTRAFKTSRPSRWCFANNLIFRSYCYCTRPKGPLLPLQSLIPGDCQICKTRLNSVSAALCSSLEIPCRVAASRNVISSSLPCSLSFHRMNIRSGSRSVYACATFAACCGFTFFPSLLYRTRGGGARFRRPSRERTRTILPWMAHETQYCSFRYILGTA